MAPQIHNAPVQQLTVGVTNVWELAAYNHPAAWEAEGLPPGLELDAAKGTITGTPRELGDYPVRLRASNGSGTNEMTVTARVSSLAIWPTGFGLSINDIPANLGTVVQAAFEANGQHVLALQAGGTVRAWGANTDGQATVPIGLSGVKQVAAGRLTSFALREDGSIVGWGRTVDGLGSASPNGNWERISVTDTYGLAVNAQGEVAIWGGFTPHPGFPPRGFPKPIHSVSAGHSHALAILDSRMVYGWGYNLYGETAAPAKLKDAVQVAGGYYFSLALRANGQIAAWGDTNRVATTPEDLDDVAMIAAGSSHAMALRENGTVVVWGMNFPDDAPKLARLRRVRWIASDGSQMRLAAVRAPGDDEIAILRPPRPATIRSIRRESVQFSIGAVGIAPLGFQWQFGGMDLPGETNRWLNIQRVAPCHLGTYTVRVSDGHSQTFATTELRAEGLEAPSGPLELDEFFQLGICVSVTTNGGRLTGVQVSEDMVQWRNLLLLPPTTERIERFVDPVSSELRQRFYRLTWNQ